MFPLVVLLVTFRVSWQTSIAYDAFYLAGVVEFRPSSELTSEARFLDNLEGYLTILNSPEAKNLDIIVFPESTLNNNEQAIFVPNPTNRLVVPCNAESGEYDSLLRQLSCAAIKLSVYLVINLTEKEYCKMVPEDTRPCSENGLNFFNTNVVFDRQGIVISRYRKIHLYGENKNITLIPEFGWFDTDFDIRFGHFICFDILFYAPAHSMVVNNGIKDFVFTSMWFSQLPFLTAVQIHQAWSYANNVNLLAAGSSNPMVGSTGSGVYHGRQGIIVAKMNQNIGERKLYVAQVPKYRSLSKRSLSESSRKFMGLRALNITFKSDDLQNYETILLDLNSNSSLKQEMCFPNSTFCCYYDLKWRPINRESDGKHYQYRLGVYEGIRNEVAAETNQLKNCAVFSCVGKDIMDCGKLFESEVDVIFENITIIATFPKTERYLIMPNSLNANIMPLPVNHFDWQETDTEKNSVRIRYELNTTTFNIMTFSIYGNYYDNMIDVIPDTDDKNGNGGVSHSNSLFGIMGILFINWIS